MRVSGLEAREGWGDGEQAEFEVCVAARTRRLRKRALWASAAFVATIAAASVFVDGHPLHRYWESVGKRLLLLSLAMWLWVVCSWAFVYSSWAAARETRREME